MKTTVLFVDDEPRILDGLRRMLRSLQHDWEVAFATTGQQALGMMAERSFDVIVSDMRMPGMGGAELLSRVMDRHPRTCRIVLSGQSTQEATLKSLRATHLFLSKPCEAETLRRTIQRALSLRDLLPEEEVRDLVTRTGSVPSLPASYLEVTKELNSPEPSISKIAAIVSRDAAMTAKILQVANSALFGGRNVSKPRQAIVRLGLTTVTALVLSVHIFSTFDVSRQRRFGLEALWAHSLATSLLARRIVEADGRDGSFADTACTAGLLHDLGKLVLAANLPDEYAELLQNARRQGMTVHEAEQDRFGATHAAVGAYLVGLWGLPHQIVEALAFHHRPGEAQAEGVSPVTAVHVANVLEQEDRPAEDHAAAKPELDLEYLARLGLSDQIQRWRAIRDSIAEEEKDDGGEDPVS